MEQIDIEDELCKELTLAQLDQKQSSYKIDRNNLPSIDLSLDPQQLSQNLAELIEINIRATTEWSKSNDAEEQAL